MRASSAHSGDEPGAGGTDLHTTWPRLRRALYSGVIFMGLIAYLVMMSQFPDLSLRHQFQGMIINGKAPTWLDHLRYDSNNQGQASLSHESSLTNVSKHDLPLKNVFILHAKHRSGSTFTSEFFHKNKNIFYLFEPLNVVEFSQWYLDGIDFLRDILTCKFQGLNDVANREWLSYIFCHPTPGMGKCPLRKLELSKYRRKCKQRPFVAAKLIRIERVAELVPLIRLGAKVLQLIRDPRGVIGSRKKYYEEYSDMRYLHDQAEDYCRDTAGDIEYIQRRLLANDWDITNAYYTLRYEDAVYDTRRTMKGLYSFLGIVPDKGVADWVSGIEARSSNKSHTLHKIEERELDTVRNDPSSVPDKWRKNTTFTEVQIIQKTCEPLMKIAGYRFVNTPEELTDMSMSVLSPFNLHSTQDGR